MYWRNDGCTWRCCRSFDNKDKCENIVIKNVKSCAFYYKAIKTLVPLWCRGKSLQAAINAEASCFNEDDNDMILFSDLLSLFKTHRFVEMLCLALNNFVLPVALDGH